MEHSRLLRRRPGRPHPHMQWRRHHLWDADLLRPQLMLLAQRSPARFEISTTAGWLGRPDSGSRRSNPHSTRVRQSGRHSRADRLCDIGFGLVTYRPGRRQAFRRRLDHQSKDGRGDKCGNRWSSAPTTRSSGAASAPAWVWAWARRTSTTSSAAANGSRIANKPATSSAGRTGNANNGRQWKRSEVSITALTASPTA